MTPFACMYGSLAITLKPVIIKHCLIQRHYYESHYELMLYPALFIRSGVPMQAKYILSIFKVINSGHNAQMI